MEPQRSSQAAGTDGEPKRLLTDEDIAALKNVIQPPQAQPSGQQRQMTPEEIDNLLHVWKPDAKWYDRLSEGGETAMKAVTEMRDGLNKQFARRMQLELAQLKEELSPGLQAAQATASKAEEERFYSSNKELNPHRDMVAFVYDKLSQSGKLQGMNQATMYKTVADETRAFLKSKGISLGSTPANAGASKTNRKVPAPLNGTSASGGGSGGQSADNPTIAALRRIG